MNPFELIAENKIREAMENGDFDHLQGQGKPIDFSRDEHIPPEYRFAYRILMNSGFQEKEADFVQQARKLREQAQSLKEFSKEERFAKIIEFKEAQSQAALSRKR